MLHENFKSYNQFKKAAVKEKDDDMDLDLAELMKPDDVAMN